MSQDYSGKNLQKASFKNEDLSNSNFSGSDLRGADFSGANLAGVNFTNARMGITPLNVAWLFLAALAVSLLSGYIATKAGQTIQSMLASNDQNIRIAGITSIVIIIL